MPEPVSNVSEFLPYPMDRAADANAQKESKDDWHYVYNTKVGFFHHDIAEASLDAFDPIEHGFGLIERTYDTDELLPGSGRHLTQWQRFAHRIEVMNQHAPQAVMYRLLYLGRHGQGYHNVGQMFYGDAAWDCYYCTFDRDPHVPTMTFADAHLTPLGKYQARTASTVWLKLISTQKIPLPQNYYNSPPSRAMQTAHLIFSTLPLPETSRFSPVIKELLLEGYGVQTCDRRSTKSYIQTNFPEFRYEASFSENDELSSSTNREPLQHLTRRARALLDDVFANDQSTFISMTSHNGTIRAILRVVGHADCSLPTGGIFPIFIRINKVRGKRQEDQKVEEDQ